VTGGLILALFATISRPGFTRPAQLEWATGFPLLAAVPEVKWRDPSEQLAALRASPYQPYAERLRRLRGGLQLQARDSKLQSILVTSAIADEGKTTTALGLAFIESLAGKSCILVDFDLRRATLGQTLDYGSTKGDLAHYLRHECPIQDAIAGIADGGFDLLSARAPAPEVVDNISAAQLRALIRDLERLYDVVIIDSPPLLTVSEGVQLADCVDAVVLVVRYGATPQRTVTEAARILEQTQPNFRGVLFSMVEASKRDNELGLGEQGY
jgi:capsular exopolysaccharide synthesis family protein